MNRVVALGSGDAFSSGARGNTCWLVEDGAPLCAVDLGPTGLLALRRVGRDPQELHAVHFTHLHGDHIAGWPFLLVDAVYRAHRTAPLAVSGPPGTPDLRTPPSDGSGASPDYPAEAGRRHLSWDDLRDLLPRLGVPLIALGHLGSEARAAADSIETEARALGLSLRVCDDLASIELES